MSPDYQKGYSAGRKRVQKDLEEMRVLKQAINERDERIYMKCLELCLRECSGWSIGGKKINDADGYCRLAKIFADNSIDKLNQA